MSSVHNLHSLIYEYAKARGIIYGICNADDLEGVSDEVLNIPFFRGGMIERISPRMFLAGAKSIIVMGVKVERAPVFEGLDRVMAASLCGADYHKRLKCIARELTSKMLESIEFKFRIQIDSGPLIERAFALRAGLGFIGKNKNLISPEFGSFFNIGLIVTDIEMNALKAASASEPALRKYRLLNCGGCDLCLLSCPTKALGEGGRFDYSRCISYLTQKKGVLSECEAAAVGVSIYGCDICQTVCPHNLPFDVSISKESTQRVLKNILDMDEGLIAYKLKDSCLLWRGPAFIRRNAAIALNNCRKTEKLN